MDRDELDDLLTPAPAATPSGLRLEWREAAARRIRRRGRVRRLAWTLALAASFLGGMAAMRWLPAGRRASPPVDDFTIRIVPERPREFDPPGERDSKALEEPDPLALASRAVETEWQAFDSKEKRAVLYFQAGSLYRSVGDLESALRCYRQALDACTPEELEVRPGDDWLVANLKEARRQGDE